MARLCEIRSQFSRETLFTYDRRRSLAFRNLFRRTNEIGAVDAYIWLCFSFHSHLLDVVRPMHLCLFEDNHVLGLRPLVETRAVYDLRLGLRTILETTLDAFPADGLVLHARPLVSEVTTHDHDGTIVNTLPTGVDVLFVNGRFVAEPNSVVSEIQERVQKDHSPRVFLQDDTLIAAWIPDASDRLPNDLLSASALPRGPFSNVPITTVDEASVVRRPWHLLDTLRPALHRDVSTHTNGRRSSSPIDRDHASVHDSVICIHPDRIHLGPGAAVHPGAILNAEEGPVYIDENAVIFERAVVKGPCYIGPKTQIKVGANVEGAAFGYYCKVGGEVHDTIIHSLSNKSHPGFLGHSYLGRWCNLGADTNTSNLRNDYGTIHAFAPEDDTFVSTGRQFAGLFMGDHAKCAINTMFNTGTVIGTFCNIYGSDFPPRYLPPFSWGGQTVGFTTYRLAKALSVAERVMKRRNRSLTEIDRSLLSTLFEQTASERAKHLE